MKAAKEGSERLDNLACQLRRQIPGNHRRFTDQAKTPTPSSENSSLASGGRQIIVQVLSM